MKIAEDPQIILFSSTDLDHWTQRGVLFRPREYSQKKMQGMEFPYLIFFGEKAVLMAGCMPAGVFYWVGRFDRQSFKFIPDDPEGLRVDYANPYPLPEFQSLRGKGYSFKNIKVTPNTAGYINIRGDALEIRAEFANHGASVFGMKVRLSEDGKTFVRVFYDAKTNECGVDTDIAKPVFPAADSKLGRGFTYIQNGEPVRLIIFLDKALIETFVNGQTCTTGMEDMNPLHDGLDLFSEDGAVTCTQLDIREMNAAF